VHIKLSLKALGAGVLLAFIASALLSLLAPYYLIPIHGLIARGSAPRSLLYHPLTIAVMLLTCILEVGVPGYLAAWIANRRFILHSLIVAVVYIALAIAISWDGIAPTSYLLVVTAWSLLVATMAGYLRQWQRRGSGEAL
jgi:hypothetical protein